MQLHPTTRIKMVWKTNVWNFIWEGLSYVVLYKIFQQPIGVQNINGCLFEKWMLNKVIWKDHVI